MNSFLDSWKKKYEAVIIFAGVFDPVHKGHISAAETALKKYGNTVVFLPERKPQHKHGATDYVHRRNMLRIATSYNPQFAVLDYPEDHQKIKETFQWLQKQFPGRSLIWLVGSDVTPFIEQWPGSDKLHDYGVEAIIAMQRSAQSDIHKVHSTDVFVSSRRRKMHEHLSSSYIRESLKERSSALPDGVFDYIVKNQLYSLEPASK